MLRERAQELCTLPVLERIEHRVRGAADEVELAVAQVLVGLGHRVEQLERRVDAFLLEEAELDRRDRREVRRRDQVRDRDFHLIPAAWTASFHVAWSSLIACVNSAGVLHAGSTPILFSRSTNAASLQPAAISRAIRSTTSRGVAAGAT